MPENNKVIRNPYTEFVELTAAEKEFYDGVTNAIRRFSTQREMFVGFLLAMPQRQVSSCMYAAAKAWNRRVLHQDSDVEISDEMVFEQFGAEVGDEDDAPLLNYLIKEILPSIDLNELRQNDSKYNRLQSILVNFLKENHNELVKKYPNIAIFAFDRIGAEIFIKGIYEKEVLEGLKDCIFNKIDTQKSVCLDVGANIGNHTLYFAQFFNQVYSIEPHPEIFELLKFNVRKYNNVKVFQFGLSNKNDEMIIATDQDTSYGSSSLRNKVNSKFEKGADDFNVQVKKFDDFFNQINEENNISFVKLDVENHELKALQGMKKTLKQNSPIICFEQHANQFDNFGKELSSTTINFLKDNEYIFFYDLSSSRDWRFVNYHYSFVKNIIKLFEVMLIGMPKITNKIVRINEFSRKKYYSIIASKTLLE